MCTFISSECIVFARKMLLIVIHCHGSLWYSSCKNTFVDDVDTNYSKQILVGILRRTISGNNFVFSINFLRNGLIDPQTPKGSHFVTKKYNAILHKRLNLKDFQNSNPLFLECTFHGFQHSSSSHGYLFELNFSSWLTSMFYKVLTFIF